MRSNILFFGDSITSGENNNYVSFVNYLKSDVFTVKNLGVSGTCIGDYSIYPVGQTNLIQQIYNNKSLVETANIIYLEYSCNDISSIITGNTNFNKVKIELTKCLNLIDQLNPRVVVKFILIGKNNCRTFGKAQVNYLNNFYLLDKKVRYLSWKYYYNKFEKFITEIFAKSNVVYLSNSSLKQDELDIDNLHPNSKGYYRISKNILLSIFRSI